MPKQNYLQSLIAGLGIKAGPQTSLNQGVSPFTSKTPAPSPFTSSNMAATASKPATTGFPGGSSALQSTVNNAISNAPANYGSTTATPQQQYTSQLTSGFTPQQESAYNYAASLAQSPNGQDTSSSGGALTLSGKSAPKTDPTSAYRTAFDSYLQSLKPSQEVQDASKSLAGIQSDIFGKQVSARHQYEATLDQQGGTVAGAQQSANLSSRRSNAELADLAVQQNAAANTLNALTASQAPAGEIAKARLDYEKSLLASQPEGFTLGKDQTRYDAQGNVVAGGSTDSGIGGAYQAGADPTVDAYVTAVRNNTIKLENVPDEYRNSVVQGVTSGADDGADPKKQYVKNQADTALSGIDDALGYISGTKSGMFNTAGSAIGRAIGGIIPGSDVANLNASLDTVKALIGFDALQKMRESSPTGGALGNITERELSFLQSVQGSLNTSQGTEQLTKTLGRIRQSFQTLQIVNSPDGTEFELDGKKYIKDGNQMVPAGFKQAGNASASKIVGGYDIGSYATDPNHEARVATIYNKVKTIGTAAQADNYIKSVAPGSPVKGTDVVAAAKARGVSVPIILAIMQQDSTFGTKGLAVKTRNPGNVGNTDSGATQTFPSWSAGVLAVANNLAKRKVA